jgi:hypothetical protein
LSKKLKDWWVEVKKKEESLENKEDLKDLKKKECKEKKIPTEKQKQL